MGAQYPQVVDAIRTKREISKDLDPELRRGIESFKKQYSGGTAAGSSPAAK